MDETQPDMKPADDDYDFQADNLPFDLTNKGLATKRQSSYNNASQGRTGAKDDQILEMLKQIMHDQKEQREQVRRIEAVIQSKFLMEEDNIQSLLTNVPHVTIVPTKATHHRRKSSLAKAGSGDAIAAGPDEVDFQFKGYSTQRIGGLGALANAELSSDDEDEDADDEESKTNSVNWISQSFKRSTKMDEISEQIQYISTTKQPLSIHFSAGSIHGNLDGNLKVVQSGLTTFLRALAQKPVERLVISTGK